MRRPTRSTPRPGASTSGHATPLLAMLAAIVLAGCGTGTTSTNALAPTPPVTVRLSSSAIHGKTLPALYTCDGRNISPPLSWGTIPSGVGEVALFALGVHAVEGKTEVSIEWALAGLSPNLHHLRAGEIPHGAFLLTGTTGRRRYSLCPARGHTQRYQFALFALPPTARATDVLPGPSLLHNLSEPVPQDESPASGVFSVSYTRR
jgi:phosphatidylethanolamine-binding protein (PEBP) family uncharacterized protein